MAKAIYSNMFAWIFEQCNGILRDPTGAPSVR